MLALNRRAALLAAVTFAAALHAAAGLGLVAALGAPPATPVSAARPALAVRTIAIATTTDPAQHAAVTAADPHRGPEFLASDEVDEPARPAQAWALDAEGLASLGITRIVFDTSVDAQAAMVTLKVVAMEPASTASLIPLVEASLAGTVMVAARKGGQAVAHHQRIDLAWQRSTRRPG